MAGNNKQKVLVIGGGPAGIEAAVAVSESGYQALLVEREKEVGGRLLQLNRLYPNMEEAAEIAGALKSKLLSAKNVETLCSTNVKDIKKNGGGFTVNLEQNGTSRTERVDAVIIATGAGYFDAAKCTEYGYGRYERVINSLDFERLLQDARKSGKLQVPGTEKPPRRVAFFQCVGSRKRAGMGQSGKPYCSKICCMYTAKQARELKTLVPDADCYVFYMDIRAAGKGYEEFVRETMEEYHIRYIRGRPSKVFPVYGNDTLMLRAEDTLMGQPIEMEVDMVVLAAALEPDPETERLEEMLQLSRDKYGFLRGRDIVSPLMAGDGVFFAGACNFPECVTESLVQAQAAARQAVSYLEMERV